MCVFSPFLASAFAAAACGFGVELFPAFFAFLPAFSFAMACRKPPVASLELAAESPNTAVRRARRAGKSRGLFYLSAEGFCSHQHPVSVQYDIKIKRG